MVSGWESERLLKIGQRAVDLQGLGDRSGALVADLVEVKAATRESEQMVRRSRDGQEMVKRWSRDGQEMVKRKFVKKQAVTSIRSARR
jgi:hypothetical protein